MSFTLDNIRLACLTALIAGVFTVPSSAESLEDTAAREYMFLSDFLEIQTSPEWVYKSHRFPKSYQQQKYADKGRVFFKGQLSKPVDITGSITFSGQRVAFREHCSSLPLKYPEHVALVSKVEYAVLSDDEQVQYSMALRERVLRDRLHISRIEPSRMGEFCLYVRGELWRYVLNFDDNNPGIFTNIVK